MAGNSKSMSGAELREYQKKQDEKWRNGQAYKRREEERRRTEAKRREEEARKRQAEARRKQEEARRRQEEARRRLAENSRQREQAANRNRKTDSSMRGGVSGKTASKANRVSAPSYTERLSKEEKMRKAGMQLYQWTQQAKEQKLGKNGLPKSFMPEQNAAAKSQNGMFDLLIPKKQEPGKAEIKQNDTLRAASFEAGANDYWAEKGIDGNDPYKANRYINKKIQQDFENYMIDQMTNAQVSRPQGIDQLKEDLNAGKYGNEPGTYDKLYAKLKPDDYKEKSKRYAELDAKRMKDTITKDEYKELWGLAAQGYADQDWLERQVTFNEQYKQREAQKLQHGYEDLPEWVKNTGDVLGNIAYTAPSLLTGVITKNPQIGFGMSGMAAGGAAAGKAIESGASVEQASDVAMRTGAKEALVNSMFGALPGQGKGVFDVGKITKNIPNAAARIAANRGLRAAGAGVENAASTLSQPLIERATYDPDAPLASVQDAGNAFLSGAAMSAILGLPEDIMAGVRSANTAKAMAKSGNDTNAQTEKIPMPDMQMLEVSKPEGIKVSPAQSKTAARQTADLVLSYATGVPYEDLQQVRAARVEAEKKADNLINSSTNKNVPVRHGEEATETNEAVKMPSRREAGMLEVTDKGNKLRYEKEIDGVFNGKLPTHEEIIIGRTPELLTLYGTPDVPLHMTQATARKIAYPEGYQGGKHNLGVQALKELPEQLENPVAILVNKSHPNNSVVAITEWNDTEGNRVIVPIEFSKQGAITVRNRINTAFGRGDLSQYLGKDYENVIYTRGDENIADLLVHGRRLPESQVSNDISTDIIPQTEGDVNRNISQGTKGADGLDVDLGRGMIEETEEGGGADVDRQEWNRRLQWPGDDGGRGEGELYGRREGGGNEGAPANGVGRKTIQSEGSHGTQEVSYDALEPSAYTSQQKALTEAAADMGTTAYIVARDGVVRFAEEEYTLASGGGLADTETGIIFLGEDAPPIVVQHEIFHVMQARLQKYAAVLERVIEHGVDRGSQKLADYYIKIKRTYGEATGHIYHELAADIYGYYKTHSRAETFQMLRQYFKADKNITYAIDAIKAIDQAYASFLKENKGKLGTVLEKDTGLSRRMYTGMDDARFSLPENDVTLEQVRQAYADLQDSRRARDRFLRKNILSEKEKKIAEDLAAGTFDADEYKIPPSQAVMDYADMLDTIRKSEQAIKQQKRQAHERRFELMEELTKNSGLWKDKKRGTRYARETQERNIEDIAKNDQTGAKAIIDTVFEPIHQNEAEGIRMMEEYRGRVEDLDLTPAESLLVQAYGEGKISDDELSGYARDAKVKNIKVTDEDGNVVYDATLRGKNALVDAEKVKAAAGEFKKIYKELIDQANTVLVKNGYPPIAERADYFPHFSTKKGLAATVQEMLGFNPNNPDAIPEDIAGLTHEFRPGKKWFSHAQQRNTDATDFDALGGFDRYLEGIKDIIYHTDDIQNVRALETVLRSKHKEEAMQKRIKEIYATAETDAEADKAISALLRDDGRLPNYITNLRNYGDMLAGKKSILDRPVEQLINRNVYTVLRAFEGRVASNMIGYNVGSWLTNFIPFVQTAGQVKTVDLLNGMKDTIKSWFRSDGFVDSSDFLVNRRGSERIVKTGLEKFSAAGVKPMEWIDNFVTETIVRGKYAEQIKAGKSTDEAMKIANRTAANIVADRSYGALPTVFHAKNPLIKPLTAFQVEVNNQYSNLFKDMPRMQKAAGGAWGMRIAFALLQYCVGAWLYNEIYEKVVGRRPAFDPIGIVGDAVNDYGQGDGVKASVNLVSNVSEQVPFVGGLLGGGRIPVSSAIPFAGSISDMAENIASVTDGNASAQERLWKEALKPIWYTAFPSGGGAAKKATEAAGALLQGGEYTVDKDGNKKLKFATDSTAKDWAQGILFGKYSTDAGQDYLDDGSILSVKSTTAHTNLVDSGIKPRRAEEIVKTIGGVEGDKDEAGNTIPGSKGRNIISEVKGMTDLNSVQKYGLYRDLVWSDSMKDDMEIAAEDFGIAKMTLVTTYERTYGLTADRDENGEPIKGTKSKKIRDIIDKLLISGTEEQKQKKRGFLYEMFGAGKMQEKTVAENTSKTVIKEAAGYDIPNYKTETLEKINKMGVSIEDYAYVSDRLEGKKDKLAYIEGLGFSDEQVDGLVEGLLMSDSGKKKMLVANEDYGIDNKTYVKAYRYGYSTVGSKGERNDQIREYVNGLNLSDEQKEALYGYVKVSRGKDADGTQTGGSSGGSGRRRSGGGRSSGSAAAKKAEKAAFELSQVKTLPDLDWSLLTPKKTAKATPNTKIPDILAPLMIGDKIREETLQKELAGIDESPLYTSEMKQKIKADIRARYRRS